MSTPEKKIEPILVFHLILALLEDKRYTAELWKTLLEKEMKLHPDCLSEGISTRVKLAPHDIPYGEKRSFKQVLAYWVRFDLTTYAHESTEVVDCFTSTEAGLLLKDDCDIDKEQLRTFLVSRKLPLPTRIFSKETSQKTDAMKAECIEIINSGIPANVASVWPELEKRCGTRGSCCLNVEETDNGQKIVWRGKNNKTNRLTKGSLKKRLDTYKGMIKGR